MLRLSPSLLVSAVALASAFALGTADAQGFAPDAQAAHRLITEWSPYAPAQRTAAL